MPKFINMPLDAIDLPKYQNVTLNGINKTYKKVILLQSTVFFVIGNAMLTSLHFIKLGFISTTTEILLFLILNFIVVINFLIRWMEFKYVKYQFRTHDLILQDGLISRTHTLVPFNRIQHVSTNQGMFSMQFGLATLSVYTAAGSSSDVSIPGLDKELAFQYKDLLLKKITSENINEECDEEH